MRVAIVHYWLVHMRGGEKVVEALCELFPDADLYTHAYEPDAMSQTIRRHRVQTTAIGRLPGVTRHYEKYLPLMPFALEALDLDDYDLVISSESGPAKGVRAAPGALHVCYCHTPMRYVWDMYEEYRATAGPVTRAAMPLLVRLLRRWDRRTASRVNHFVANSQNVRNRIRCHWGRDAEVIHPPVDTGRFAPAASVDDFYLLAGALVAYKRPDLAVEAFNRMGKPLVVIGGGKELERLRRMAGPTITCMGRQPDEVLADHYARCRALVFPGVEDFGIVPVEAMASGRPVIALGQGGALETVREGVSGLFFRQQTVEALIDAVRRFEADEHTFSTERIVEHARRFDRSLFKRRMGAAIDRLLENRHDLENQYAP